MIPIAMSAKHSQLQITKNFLPYNALLEVRSTDSIKLLVIHCTELPDLATARSYGETIHYPNTDTGNSGHFYIERDGKLHQWVALDRVAHHVAGCNANSIGIELINLGRYPHWRHSERQTMTQTYTAKQVQALIALIATIRSDLPKLQHIVGHQDLDQRKIAASDQPTLNISRKLDPGPLFPWGDVIAASGLTRMNG